MSAISEWVADVFARGGELYTPRGRPAIWPHTVATADDRRFMRAHRAELVALVQRNEQPRLPDDPVPPEVESFARDLLARGIALLVRNNRLWVQPGRAYQDHLTDAERTFLHDRRTELKTLAAAGTLPEPTVQWAPPTPSPTPTSPSETYCEYGCGTLTDCERLKAERLSTWRAAHWLDPAEVARRRKEATAEMFESWRRGTQLRD